MLVRCAEFHRRQVQARVGRRRLILGKGPEVRIGGAGGGTHGIYKYAAERLSLGRATGVPTTLHFIKGKRVGVHQEVPMRETILLKMQSPPMERTWETELPSDRAKELRDHMVGLDVVEGLCRPRKELWIQGEN